MARSDDVTLTLEAATVNARPDVMTSRCAVTAIAARSGVMMSADVTAFIGDDDTGATATLDKAGAAPLRPAAAAL